MTPMEKAWMILKRQTTLGEFHPDMPSPYGPVTHYRGTGAKHFKDIEQHGFQPRYGYYGDAVYLTPDIELARRYADKHRWGIPSGGGFVNTPRTRSDPYVVAVRGQNLNIQDIEEEGGERDTSISETPIPPQYLVRREV